MPHAYLSIVAEKLHSREWLPSLEPVQVIGGTKIAKNFSRTFAPQTTIETSPIRFDPPKNSQIGVFRITWTGSLAKEGRLRDQENFAKQLQLAQAGAKRKRDSAQHQVNVVQATDYRSFERTTPSAPNKE